MNKKQAIHIMTKASKLYRDNLEDQKVLFIYGIPKNVNKEIEQQRERFDSLDYYETVFQRRNFLHLTGIKINKENIASAIQFYDKCLDGRLSDNDFEFSSDGSSIQKLEILESMMAINKTVAMIGDFSDRGTKLYSQKAAGGVCGCIGFVTDREAAINVPNTLLKKDIRDVTANPTQKVYAVMCKHFTAVKYVEYTKKDKIIQDRKVLFSNAIEELIERK